MQGIEEKVLLVDNMKAEHEGVNKEVECRLLCERPNWLDDVRRGTLCRVAHDKRGNNETECTFQQWN